jgi:hypothetical protein
MKTLFVALLIALAATALPARAETYADRISNMSEAQINQMEKEALEQFIPQSCEKEWPNNYRMQVYCREKESEAARWAYFATKSIRAAVLEQKTDANVIAKIMGQCFGEWPGNFRMIAHCFKKEVDAFYILRKQDSDRPPSPFRERI